MKQLVMFLFLLSLVGCATTRVMMKSCKELGKAESGETYFICEKP
jgi:hypothetical protein